MMHGLEKEIQGQNEDDESISGESSKSGDGTNDRHGKGTFDSPLKK